MIRKYLCLLSVTLLAGTLISCAGQQPNPTQPTSAEPTASPTASAPATAQPASSPSGGGKSDDVTALAGNFIDLLVKEDYATAFQNFDDTMKAAMPQDKLKQTWMAILAQAGPFKRQVSTRSETVTANGQQYTAVTVTCEFEKANLDVRVVFNSAKQVSGLFAAPAQSANPTPQATAARPASIQERDVTVGTGDWKLPGTLTLPNGTGPFPAVVLVHGSGPNDRDETIGPNKPFRDLAWGLASRGVAVLRYDKRTLVYASRLAPISDTLTVQQETIDDALAAVSLLRQTDTIKANQVFVLGHSLGGMLIPRIGQQDPKIAGFISLAGATRPLEDEILEQVTYLASLQNADSPEVKAQLDQLKQQVARVKDPNLSTATPASDLPLGVPAAYWLDLRGYNPAEVAKSLPQPMLILQGERDYQVTTADFDGWKKALGDRQNVQFKLYPTLNHLFMEGQGKSTPEEYNVASHVAEYVVDDIANWVKGVASQS